MIERVSLEKQNRYFNELSKYKYKCKCGHVVVMLPGTDKCLCTWCHNYVFKHKKDEFVNRMRGILNEQV